MKQIHIFTIFATPRAFFNGQFGYLTEHGHEIILITSYDTDTEKFVEDNGIQFIPVKMPRALSPISIILAIKQIMNIIKREKPDAVFGHTPVGALCAMIAAKICGIRNRIYYRHGLIYTTMSGIKRTAFRMEERLVSSLATVIINVSPSLSSLAVKDRLNNDAKQYVIGHGTCGGIDSVNLFNPELIERKLLVEKQKELGLEHAEMVFGFCGRICNDKGVPELIDAFDLFRLRNGGIRAKLLLIGSMDIRDNVNEHYASKIENDTDIIITGYVNKANIPYYYALLDVFVFPSYREGFGMCVLEASAMKKPILVSRSHGCVDSIIEHETGEYIDISAESICLGMESMMDANRRKAVGEKGRYMVMQRYDNCVMWPLVNDFYSKILR